MRKIKLTRLMWQIQLSKFLRYLHREQRAQDVIIYTMRERERDIHTYGLTALDHDGNTVQRSQSCRQGWSCRKCARTAVQPFFFLNIYCLTRNEKYY